MFINDIGCSLKITLYLGKRRMRNDLLATGSGKVLPAKSRRVEGARDDVAEQHRLQGLHILQEPGHRPGRKLVKSLIRGCEDSKGPGWSETIQIKKLKLDHILQ